MHGGIKTHDDEPMAEMNMIPLIDIALTLLIIMMVTTAFVKHPGVSLKLPETATREGAPETNKDLTVIIAADGKVYLDGKPRQPAELQAHFKAIAQRNKEARVLVKGDRSVLYSRIMEVMDLVRQAGLTRVVLPTDPKQMQPSGDPAASTSGVLNTTASAVGAGVPRRP
jgi:biopolymer transport protein ExbD